MLGSKPQLQIQALQSTILDQPKREAAKPFIGVSMYGVDTNYGRAKDRQKKSKISTTAGLEPAPPKGFDNVLYGNIRVKRSNHFATLPGVELLEFDESILVNKHYDRRLKSGSRDRR